MSNVPATFWMTMIHLHRETSQQYLKAVCMNIMGIMVCVPILLSSASCMSLRASVSSRVAGANMGGGCRPPIPAADLHWGASLECIIVGKWKDSKRKGLLLGVNRAISQGAVGWIKMERIKLAIALTGRDSLI